MKNELRKSLRKNVLVTWGLLFLAFIVLALIINGGFGITQAKAPTFIVVVALLASSLFALSIRFLPSIQSWSLQPDCQVEAIKGELLFVAGFAGFLGLGLTVDFLLRVLGN